MKKELNRNNDIKILNQPSQTNVVQTNSDQVSNSREIKESEEFLPSEVKLGLPIGI